MRYAAVVFDWNDLRLFLQVARAGSTLAAARALGVNQTTVARRIATLEHGLGLALFERGPRGYELTADGAGLLLQAEAVEAATLRLEAEAGRRARDLAGSIRVTATHPIMRHLIGPLIGSYRRINPEVTFEILTAARHLSLEDGEADVAFRSAKALTGDTLVATRLPDITATLYCSDAYRERHGAPGSPAEIAGHPVLVYAGTPGMERFAAWLLALSSPARIAGSANTPEDMVGTLLSGMGVSVLPCFLGDATPGLGRCFEPPPDLDRAWWAVASHEAYGRPRVRSFMAFAAEHIRLEGAGVRRPGRDNGRQSMPATASSDRR
ncbi:MAG: LysR family transcriptional regulator [Bauldia sp.]|nr:LysR family transcriptional regulator [Bauldia sp.]